MEKYIDIINSIKKDKLNAGEGNLKTLAGAIDRIQKAFPRYSSFLMEFVQNADDSESSKLLIELSEKEIRISNNGKSFDEDDVRSICDIAGSKKSPEEYIGYLGVGFKSVFLVSDMTKIYSGNYSFKFDKNLYENPKKVPWQIIPHLIEDNIEQIDEFTTTFIFNINNDNMMEKLRKEIEPEHINERLLLFLRNIKEIVLIDKLNNIIRKMKKTKIFVSDDYCIESIEHSYKNTLDVINWLVFKKSFEVPESVTNDYMTIQWERSNINKREIMIVFKLTNDGKLDDEIQGTAHIGVFSYLPLKEVESGLKFLIQADLLTTPGRNSLPSDSLWNNWLIKSCYQMIEDNIIDVFQKNAKWKYNYLSILSNRYIGDSIFYEYIIKPLNEYIDNQSLLVAENGDLEKPENLIYIDKNIRDLMDGDDIALLYGNKKVINENCEYPFSIKGLTEVPKEIYDFIKTDEGVKYLSIIADKKQINAFINLYKLFLGTYNSSYFMSQQQSKWKVNHDHFWNTLARTQIELIPTNEFKLVCINNSYINAQRIIIPEELNEKPNLINEQLYSDEIFLRLHNYINEMRYTDKKLASSVMQVLEEIDVKNMIKKQEVNKITKDKWGKYSSEDKKKYTKDLKELFSKGMIEAIDDFIDVITVKSADGSWKHPAALVFGSKYQSEYDLEYVVNTNLYDYSIDFISNEYLENDDYKYINEWKEFFKTLGVGKILTDKENSNPIVQRIAVLTTLSFEKKKKREAHERTESEKKEGWDIDSGERKIEVKGTAKTSGYDLILTKGEQKALFRENNYYIYIVTNALKKPVLHVIDGKVLVDCKDDEDVKRNYVYKLWYETSGAKIDEEIY